jgi:hypothetical protein
MTETERILLIARAFDLAREAIRAAIWIAGFYYLYLSVAELAGKKTLTWMALQAFVSVDNDYGAPWIIAFLALVYAAAQRKLRLHKTEEMQGHIRELETRLDPNRTSSGLTSTGQTPRGKNT